MEQNANLLIEAMSTEQLQAMKVQFKDSPNVIALLDTVLTVRTNEANLKKLQDAFTKAVESIKLPVPPDGISNVYFGYAEVDDTSKPEVVKIEGKPDETRYPKIRKWILEVNKAMKPVISSSGDTDKSDSSKKRAITVLKRDGMALTTIGNFKSASKACEYLKLDVSGDSATRVLASKGYITEQYIGTSFTA